MIHQRSRLPLVLILAVLLGVLAVWQHRQGSGVVGKPPGFSPASDRSVKAVNGFGPIPTVAPPDEVHRLATPHGPPEAGRASASLGNLAARMSRETQGLAVVTHADGRRSVELGGRFTHMSVAVTGVDGKTRIRCFSDYHEMIAALNGQPAPEVPNLTPHVR